MPVVRDPGDLPVRQGTGWAEQAWAGPEELGAPVPMQAWRWAVDRSAASPPIGLGAAEGLLYVIAGSGTAAAGGGWFPLSRENVLWLGGCPEVTLRGGARGLDVLIAQAPGRGRGGGQGRGRPQLFTAAELPHLVSTRDTRDRLDLVTDAVPVGARQIRADRIVYHPGDSAAAHFHAGCHHVFCVLAGEGLLCTERAVSRLAAGMSALVLPGEMHWFVNDRDADFSFVEFWAPPPADTVWPVASDRCSWAPA
ncbi:MAG TPA: cupin domain-containing protein [Streptosporangiaceae bacterium]|nr:cupin domain-containing protein [Streptosporangiaceae bacterium]